jgi:hypothetical protein
MFSMSLINVKVVKYFYSLINNIAAICAYKYQ